MACGQARIAAAATPTARGLMLDPQPADEGRQPSRGVNAWNARGRYAYRPGAARRCEPGGRHGALMKTFEHREAGPNRMWLGDDGAMAAWALGRIRDPPRPCRCCERRSLWEPPAGWKESDDDGPPRWPVYGIAGAAVRAARLGPDRRRRGGRCLGRGAAIVRSRRRHAGRRNCLVETAEAGARFPADDRPAVLEHVCCESARAGPRGGGGRMSASARAGVSLPFGGPRPLGRALVGHSTRSGEGHDGREVSGGSVCSDPQHTKFAAEIRQVGLVPLDHPTQTHRRRAGRLSPLRAANHALYMDEEERYTAQWSRANLVRMLRARCAGRGRAAGWTP